MKNFYLFLFLLLLITVDLPGGNPKIDIGGFGWNRGQHEFPETDNHKYFSDLFDCGSTPCDSSITFTLDNVTISGGKVEFPSSMDSSISIEFTSIDYDDFTILNLPVSSGNLELSILNPVTTALEKVFALRSSGSEGDQLIICRPEWAGHGSSKIVISRSEQYSGVVEFESPSVASGEPLLATPFTKYELDSFEITGDSDPDVDLAASSDLFLRIERREISNHYSHHFSSRWEEDQGVTVTFEKAGTPQVLDYYSDMQSVAAGWTYDGRFIHVRIADSINTISDKVKFEGVSVTGSWNTQYENIGLYTDKTNPPIVKSSSFEVKDGGRFTNNLNPVIFAKCSGPEEVPAFKLYATNTYTNNQYYDNTNSGLSSLTDFILLIDPEAPFTWSGNSVFAGAAGLWSAEVDPLDPKKLKIDLEQNIGIDEELLLEGLYMEGFSRETDPVSVELSSSHDPLKFLPSLYQEFSVGPGSCDIEINSSINEFITASNDEVEAGDLYIRRVAPASYALPTGSYFEIIIPEEADGVYWDELSDIVVELNTPQDPLNIAGHLDFSFGSNSDPNDLKVLRIELLEDLEYLEKATITGLEFTGATRDHRPFFLNYQSYPYGNIHIDDYYKQIDFPGLSISSVDQFQDQDMGFRVDKSYDDFRVYFEQLNPVEESLSFQIRAESQMIGNPVDLILRGDTVEGSFDVNINGSFVQNVKDLSGNPSQDFLVRISLGSSYLLVEGDNIIEILMDNPTEKISLLEAQLRIDAFPFQNTVDGLSLTVDGLSKQGASPVDLNDAVLPLQFSNNYNVDLTISNNTNSVFEYQVFTVIQSADGRILSYDTGSGVNLEAGANRVELDADIQLPAIATDVYPGDYELAIYPAT